MFVQTAGHSDGGGGLCHPVEEGGHGHGHHQGCSLGEEDTDVGENGSCHLI